jgi:hypothetical protein
VWVEIADAQQVLDVLIAGFPSYPVNERTSELYLAAIAGQVASASVGMEAARDIITSQLYFPKIAELLDACRAVAKRRRARPRGELPRGEPLSTEENAQRLQALRDMRVTLQSTTKVIELEIDGAVVPGRVWEGQTEDGIPCAAVITRIAAHQDHDRTRFELDLSRCADPRPHGPAVEAFPMRLVL